MMMTDLFICVATRGRSLLLRLSYQWWPLIMCLLLCACTACAAEPNTSGANPFSNMTQTNDKHGTHDAASQVKGTSRDDALPAAADAAGKVNDVIFATAYDDSTRPKSADFYYNGRAIGSGREAFAEIVERIANLPKGTSIVWGPNYHRAGNGGGSVYGCAPKFLYANIWKDLEFVAAKRGLSLSSDYPGPRLSRIPGDNRGHLRASVGGGDQPGDDDCADACLDWEVKSYMRKPKQPREVFVQGAHRHMFLSAGQPLSRFGLDLFFGRLPEGAHVLIRVSCAQDLDPSTSAVAIRTGWQSWLSYPLQVGKITATLGAPARVAAEVCTLIDRPTIEIDWANFHGPKTAHDEVLYRVNGRYVGRGDEGFDQVLVALRFLPEGAEVKLAQYEHGGLRVWHSGRSEDEIEARIVAVKKVVPFAARKVEIEAVIANRKLNRSFSRVWLDLDPRTVMDWESGDRFGEAFVSFGKIIHSGDKPHTTMLSRLSWAHYEQGGRIANGRIERRQLEVEAVYMLDGVDLGQGVAGFASAMRKLANLPEGSVVQVRVCLRTTPPFRCPITYQGRRHFERTGFEPYAGMFPWLIDVARKNKLQIEWIPDELNSCEDCELNK